MKKIIILLLFLNVILLNSQEQRQKVIVEIGTGTWCPSCPAVVHIIDDFIAQDLDIAVIKYHNNDSYTNAASIARENYYDFPWYPTTYYDSNHIGFEDWATQSTHLSYYNNQINTSSPLSLAISNVQINNSALTGLITLDNITSYTGQNVKLHIVLTESNIQHNWQGESELDFVERNMFPNWDGTNIDLTNTDIQNINFHFNIDSSWDASNLEIVYFLQNDDTKEILQGDAFELSQILGENDFVLKETSIYPNPSNKELFFNKKQNTLINKISIYNLFGKQVLYIDQNINSISVDNLSKGMYLISFYENDIKKTLKFIKD